jgi:site-specific recombinase XerC
MIRANRRRPPTADGGVIHVHGKGRKDRRIPVETTLIDVIGDYLATRAAG